MGYPGVRQDRVWIQEGQVVLENGLLVKGSATSPAGDQTSLTERLRGHAREQREEKKDRGSNQYFTPVTAPRCHKNCISVLSPSPKLFIWVFRKYKLTKA